MVGGIKNRYIAPLVLAALLLLAAAAFIVTNDQDSVPPPGSAYSFLIYREGEETKAKNTVSGEVMFSSNDSRDTIQRTIGETTSGGKVLVSEGDYRLNGPLDLKDHMALEGEGPGTRFYGEESFAIRIEERSNVVLGNFTVLGTGMILVAGYVEPARDVLIHDITATTDSANEGVFYCLATETTVSNISFLRCVALDCGTNGFINNGGRSLETGWVENISYIQCRAVNSGLAQRYNDWVVGFDLAERANIRNMSLLDCESSGSWQSGFHFEPTVRVDGAVLENCVANDNGRSQGAPSGEGYGWGYMLFPNLPQHDISLSNCTASGNWRGDTNLGPLDQEEAR